MRLLVLASMHEATRVESVQNASVIRSIIALTRSPRLPASSVGSISASFGSAAATWPLARARSMLFSTSRKESKYCCNTCRSCELALRNNDDEASRTPSNTLASSVWRVACAAFLKIKSNADCGSC